MQRFCHIESIDTPPAQLDDAGRESTVSVRRRAPALL
jgi:hypothetical protein